MSETISLDFLGAMVRQMQAEQRTQRSESDLVRRDIGQIVGSMATRELLLEVLGLLTERIGNFEALMETRMDRLYGRFDQIAAKLDARP